ncbi:Crp/Fnr family transcriptional regulator [Pelomonas aquatica]|jgi:CRP-like cAMP-binding protein|uniref:Crp/Fnr family transcriptional regulator n=1 Tax=Pelomonas aquatica TaxID=431058 RepID=A0A9X4LLM7_9BURK|nr:Crp/Fnr family transcriptional regulator [Pelomonas aquatica]MCY4756293.1 Crp/Fnr family transcriptional regulator [Pelomonas aquatica]MDG0864812.1 Crp/Fnr family transcriptional regulator [Pelomonas aquatica]
MDVQLAQHWLQRLPLFSEVGPESLQPLAAAARLQALPKGAFALRAGDACGAFFVNLGPPVKLFVLAANGNEKVVELVAAGQSFAEALMFLGRPSPVHAQALGDTQLLVLPREAVLEAMAADQRLALRMLAGLSRRLHGLVADVQAYALQSGVQRVIGYLLRDAAGPGACAVELPVSKATLASRLSLTPEYFSRVLRELEEGGLIAVEGRRIRIASVERLAAYPHD